MFIARLIGALILWLIAVVIDFAIFAFLVFLAIVALVHFGAIG